MTTHLRTEMLRALLALGSLIAWSAAVILLVAEL